MRFSQFQRTYVPKVARYEILVSKITGNLSDKWDNGACPKINWKAHMGSFLSVVLKIRERIREPEKLFNASHSQYLFVGSVCCPKMFGRTSPRLVPTPWHLCRVRGIPSSNYSWLVLSINLNPVGFFIKSKKGLLSLFWKTGSIKILAKFEKMNIVKSHPLWDYYR